MLAVVTGLLVLVLRKKTHTPVSGSVEPSVAITRCMRCLDDVEAGMAQTSPVEKHTRLAHDLTKTLHTYQTQASLPLGGKIVSLFVHLLQTALQTSPATATHT